MGKSKNTPKKSTLGIKPWIKVTAWTVGILFLLILCVSLLHTAGILQRSITAVTVDGYKLSAMDYNIYYADVRNNFLTQYGQTLQALGYTLDESLDKQESLFSEEGTWGDYFDAETVNSIQRVVALHAAGKAAGHEMNNDYALAYTDHMASYLTTAMQYGVTEQAFINSVYGNGTKLADLERVNEMNYYAESYGQSLKDAYNIGDAEIDAYYEENRAVYDRVDYYQYSFPYTTYTYTEPAEGESLEDGAPQSEEEATQLTEASKAEAKAQADAFMAQLKSKNDFDAVAESFFNEAEATHTHEDGEEHTFTSALVTGGKLEASGSVVEWIADLARQKGDREILDNNSDYVVVQYEQRYIEEIPTATVRHILFPFSTSITEESTEEEKSTHEFEKNLVLQTAQTVYAEWQGGAADENSFAELAKEHSQDGNAAEGGIYEHFSQGAMVEPFDNWCFDESRVYGDNSIVETEFGYHMMFFVSHDQPAYRYTIQTSLSNERFESYMTGLTEAQSVSVNGLGVAVSF